MKEKLLTRCPFPDALRANIEGGYPESEFGYIRAYYKDGCWWNTFFPVHRELGTPELIEEFDQVYVDFKKDFKTLGHVLYYVVYNAKASDDPDEGNAYLELKHGLYWLRIITRRGDYNLYLTCLSRSACEKQKGVRRT